MDNQELYLGSKVASAFVRASRQNTSKGLSRIYGSGKGLLLSLRIYSQWNLSNIKQSFHVKWAEFRTRPLQICLKFCTRVYWTKKGNFENFWTPRPPLPPLRAVWSKKNAKKPLFAETGASPLAKNELLHLVFHRLYEIKKKSRKYAHHYNRCKIRRRIQIRGQNRVNMQRKAGKCRKLWRNRKIACIKKRCGKISSAPITIWKSIKKGNFLRLVDPTPTRVLVITVFLFFGFLNFPPFIEPIGAN